MDAQAYLLKQGWSGPGNPLNPHRRPGGAHGGLGLTKPILVARKQNTHGIGKKTTHDHTNQWWLRGFEAALKGVGEDGTATPSSQDSNQRTATTSDLYRFFVRGEGLAGTIDEKNKPSGLHVSESADIKNGDLKSRKRKREDTHHKNKGTKSSGSEQDKLARKEEKRKKKDLNKDGSSSRETSAEERQAKLKRKEDKRQMKKEKKEALVSTDQDCSSDAIQYVGPKSSRKKKRKTEQSISDSTTGKDTPGHGDVPKVKKDKHKKKKSEDMYGDSKREKKESKRREKKVLESARSD